MKNQKGISLVALIITIIVIVILSAIVISGSFNRTLDDTSFTRIVSEMTEVYDAVVQRSLEHKLDDSLYAYVGTPLTDDSPEVIDGKSYGDGYYFIKEQADKEALSLERVRGNYIVNYTTGEVISSTKINYEGGGYYTLEDIANVVQPGSNVASGGEYDDDKGVNKPIISEGMVPVKEENNEWVVTTEDDNEWYDYANGKWATVMLLDELAVTGKSNSEIRAMSQSERIATLDGAVVEVEGSTFVWVPRYTYKLENGEVKVMYSHLTEDYVADGYTKNPAFYFGEYNGAESDLANDNNTGYVGGGKELTGIWVSKYEAGFSN